MKQSRGFCAVLKGNGIVPPIFLKNSTTYYIFIYLENAYIQNVVRECGIHNVRCELWEIADTLG